MGRLEGLPQPHSASFGEVIGGISRLAERSHQRGIKLYVATLIPIAGMPPNYYSPEQDKVRNAVNDWIRSSTQIDGHLDFDRALADPQRPDCTKPAREYAAYPNAAEEQALSQAVNLSLFE